ncbi:MAG: WXG100 family type VII secretion target [Lachnospiraceae bacterium]|nr:WXG100 family type VII secretion target [Lachnospiraceae bacterium]
MASQIRVTSTQINSKKERLQQLNSTFKSRLEDMNTTEKQLLTMWEGDAAKAFKASYDRDYKKMLELHKVVQSYCKALEQIVKQYEQSERKNVSTAKNRG